MTVRSTEIPITRAAKRHNPLPKEEAAAIKIQTVFREYLRRHLPIPVRRQYRPLIDEFLDVEKRQNEERGWSYIPRHPLYEQSSEYGTIPVFLPAEIPTIVIKYAKENAFPRLQNISCVRSILTSQKAKHLIVPEADLYKGCLAETRLPIVSETYENFAIYINNVSAFDAPVCEMVRLFSKAVIHDLVIDLDEDDDDCSGQYALVGDTVMCPNLPLFMLNGEAKIGLIDLEHLHKNPTPAQIEEGLLSLARIFPFHVELIRKTAEDLKLPLCLKELEAHAKRGKEYLETDYINHLAWLRAKGITTASPIGPIKLPDGLIQALTDQLLALNDMSSDLESCFMPLPAETIAAELATTIGTTILREIQPKALSDLPKNDAELVGKRLHRFCYTSLYKKIVSLLKNHPQTSFPEKSKKNDDTSKVATRLLDGTMENLVANKELFFFRIYPAEQHEEANETELCYIKF